MVLFWSIWFADPIKLKSEIEKAMRGGGDAAVAYFDMKMTSQLNKHTSSSVINELLSEGLLKPTGKNWISLMTTSGAKGSKVSFALSWCLEYQKFLFCDRKALSWCLEYQMFLILY